MDLLEQLSERLGSFLTKLANHIKEGKWYKLLPIIVLLFFIGFGPKIESFPFIGVVIFSIIREPPTWFRIAFWLIEGALCLAFVLLELKEQPAGLPQFPLCRWFHSRQTKRFGMFLLTSVVLVVLAWHPIVVPLYLRVMGIVPPLDPNQNSVLPCDIRNSKDCFSWGEDILILADTAFTGEEARKGWRGKCREHWDLKEDGISSYKQLSRKGFEQAADDFRKFVARCPNDPEARIYWNNAKAELDENPIKIAVSVPISRQSDSLSKQDEQEIKEEIRDFQQVLRGVALAQDKINNNGGIQNKKLLVGIGDDGYKIVSNDDDETRNNRAEMSTSVATFLRERRDIVGVIGHSSSDATKVAEKIYASEIHNEEKLVAVSPTSTAVRKPQNPKGFNLGEYVFRTAIDDEAAAYPLAVEASDPKRGIKKIAIVYDSIDEYSKSFKDAFREKFVKLEGGEVVNDESKDWCDISQNARYKKDPMECLKQAKKGDAEALLLVPSAANVEHIETLVKFNSQNAPLRLLGSDTMYNPRFLIKEAKDMIVVVPWHRHIKPLNFEEQAKYLFGYQDDKNGKQEPFKINWETAMAYDATQALAEGLRKASQNCWWNPSRLWDKYAQPTCLRKELKNALSDINFKAEGVLGLDTVEFDPKGDRVPVKELGVLVKVCKVENSFEFRRINECQAS